MRNHAFKLQLLILTVVVLFTGREAQAIDNGACCVQSTSRLESLMNPAKGSDEDFFSYSAGAPNVMLIIDTSASMQDWPSNWPTAKGCYTSGASGHGAYAGYVPTVNYPAMYTGFTSQTIPTEHNNWFNRDRHYKFSRTSSGLGTDFANSGTPNQPSGWPRNGLSDSAACTAFNGSLSAGDQTLCQTCLANNGYYLHSDGQVVADGNFLNYYGPRDFAAVSALSHLVFQIREVRMSVMTLTNYGGGSTNDCYNGVSGQNNCGCIMEPIGPTCDKAFPLDKSAVQNNRNSILNKLAKSGTWGGCGTPLADLEYAAGYYMKSTSPDGFTALSGHSTYGNFDESGGPNGKRVCSACGFNAIILISDGEPTGENASLIPTGMRTPAVSCTGAYCGSYLNEVAQWLWTNDIRGDYGNTQKVATYTVGISLGTDATTLLQTTATAGGGKYYPADKASELEAAVLTIFQDILSRNTSFASAAVSTVQTASSTLPAILPRMLPKPNRPWEGRLWRFDQYNEFVEDFDLNGDSDKEDVFIVENAGGPPGPTNIVVESNDGTFVKTGTSVPATEFWEANKKLVTDLGSNVANRKVWTVLDTHNPTGSGGDGAFTSHDTVTRVKLGTEAEDLVFAEYMGLRGNTTACPSGSGLGLMLTKFGISLAQLQTATGFTLPGTPAAKDYDRLCTRMVILWLLGGDLYDEDGDGTISEARPVVMGDIFHSSPLMVEPPIDPFLCDLGLSNQCVRTLYSQLLGVNATQLDNYSPTVCSASSTKNAYETYAYEQRLRQKLVMVGANDGMVHAFVGGVATDGCTGGVPTPTYDRGTGAEAWAFIPPDQLPKVADSILDHQYMIDGDVMVRDIWADGSGATGADGRKQKDEFHTLAVVAEGRGGKHYFALEIKYDSAGVPQTPAFRWMFPQPCSEESATFGRTFMSLSPKPPPIGPVMLDSSTISGAPTGVNRYGLDTQERWMVMVSGGWSPSLEKGRGIYMLDAWHGAINGRRDNLWWKFEFDEGASGFQAPARDLTMSVAAPIAMVDFGTNDTPKQDGFFDTATFGDTQGQLWMARFSQPLRYSSSTKELTNVAVARAFEMDRDGVPAGASGTTLPDGGTEPADPNAKLASNKWPFFHLPSVAIEPGVNKMRVFAGTGNRYAVLEGGAGSCRFDNPQACSKNKCSEFKTVSKYEDGIVKLDKVETHWKSRRFEHGKLDETIKKAPTASLVNADFCGSTGGTRVVAENQEYKIGTCDLTSGTDPNPGQVNEIKYECGLDSSGNSFLCTRQSVDRTGGLDDLLDPTLVDNSGLGRNRFVGIWAYGAGRNFVELADGGTTPSQFDGDRLSDRTSGNANSGDLIDVTQTSCTQTSCDGGAPLSAYGWFVDYSALDTKTATGSAVLASCVLWSDISPTGGDGGACATSATPLSQVYQADYITGQPNCAYGFLDGGVYVRTQARTVVAPPPEPASVVQISKTGEVRYSAMIVEPGKDQATTVNVSGAQDPLQFVYQLPLSRSLHDCRHADGGCVAVP